jgi:hypothetical protein
VLAAVCWSGMNISRIYSILSRKSCTNTLHTAYVPTNYGGWLLFFLQIQQKGRLLAWGRWSRLIWVSSNSERSRSNNDMWHGPHAGCIGMWLYIPVVVSTGTLIDEIRRRPWIILLTIISFLQARRPILLFCFLNILLWNPRRFRCRFSGSVR